MCDRLSESKRNHVCEKLVSWSFLTILPVPLLWLKIIGLIGMIQVYMHYNVL